MMKIELKKKVAKGLKKLKKGDRPNTSQEKMNNSELPIVKK